MEEGEECDCGWEEDCRDQCCFPMRRYASIDEPPCRLTPKSICSPSQVSITKWSFVSYSLTEYISLEKCSSVYEGVPRVFRHILRSVWSISKG